MDLSSSPSLEAAGSPSPSLSATATASPDTKSYVFKVVIGDEIRRLSVTRQSRLNKILQGISQASSPSPSPSPSPSAGVVTRLTYKDEEGDDISLKTQQDLAECLAYLDAASLAQLRLQAEVAPAPSPSAEGLQEATPSSPSSSSSSTPPSPAPEPPKDEPFDGPETEDAKELQLEQELQELEGQVAGSLCEVSLVPPRVRRLLDGLNARLEREEGARAATLARLKAHPFFGEAEYQRQKRVLEEAQVPPSSFLEILIVKRLVQARRRVKLYDRDALTPPVKTSWRPRDDAGLRAMGPEVLAKLELLHSRGLPGGLLMGRHLQRTLPATATSSAAGAAPSPSPPSEDPLLARQLEELETLRHIPKDTLARILTRVNAKGFCPGRC